MILNMCAPNNRVSKHTKQKQRELKETEPTHITVGDFNTPVSARDTTTQTTNSESTKMKNSTALQLTGSK